jgi:hypothetical protein
MLSHGVMTRQEQVDGAEFRRPQALQQVER